MSALVEPTFGTNWVFDFIGTWGFGLGFFETGGLGLGLDISWAVPIPIDYEPGFTSFQ